MFSRNKGVVADGLCVISSAKESYKPSLKIRIDMSLKRRAHWFSCTILSPDFSFPGLSDSAKQTTGVLLLALISLSVSSAQAASPFTTEGKFSVGSDGSANYSIPIVVPPGTAGMQPQLALNYNSNGGNGIVGMGWGIDGLSQISRCPTTLEQDGVINGVNYTNTDRFCLDGQRLIATTDSYVTHPTDSTRKIYTTTSAYGANGTEYRTESANFAKIISYGQAGTGPAYFKVWTKSGQIIEYGNTVDSGIEAQGKPTIRTWGVNKISDTKGNYISVSYTEDNANGEAYVQKIDYTGNASSTPALTPYANVQFIYEARPDTNIAYQAGSALKSTKRLTNIQTYNATTLIKNYKFTYELSQSTNRSRLKTVRECDGFSASTCKQLTAIGWENNAQSGFASTSIGGFNKDYTNLVPGDYNGDGKTDFIRQDGSAWGGGTWVYLSSGNGVFTSLSLPGMNRDYTNLVPGDYNGDGKTDFIKQDGSAWGGGTWVYLSNGDGTFTATSIGGLNREYTDLVTGDYNGDGKTDFIRQDGSAWGGGTWVYLSSGNGVFTSLSLPGMNRDYTNLVPGDYNGDGKTDFIKQDGSAWGGGTWVYLSNGDGTFTATSIGGLNREYTDLVTGDYNGDGKTDFIRQDGSAWGGGTWVYLSSGNGVFTSLSLPGMNRDYTNLVPGDYNGDGKTDFIKQDGSAWGGGTWVYLSNGDGTFTATSIGGLNREYTDLVTGDYNGDGKTDFIRQDGSAWKGGTFSYMNIPYGIPDLLSTINSDQSVAITYKPITDNMVYMRDSLASGSSCEFVSGVYPIQDIQESAYIVLSTSVSDGVGGVVTTSYQYGGLKSHVRGRGSLGFRYVKESSPDSGLSVTTFYRQDFPFIGLPCQVEKRRLSDNALLSVVQNTYANSDLATSTIISKFPYLSQSVEQAYELDSSLVSTTTTTNQYDDYGNVTSVKVDDGLGNIKTTTSTYNNNVGNWLLGRLIRSTVTSVTP